MFKVYVCAKRGYILDEAYVNYRVDNENSSVKSKGKVYCVCEEIAECKNFLDNRSDKWIYMPYLIKVMFYIYRWNIRRLSISYWKEFISFISSELKKDKEDVYFKEDIFSSEERLEYLLLSDYPEKYMQYKLLEEINVETDNNKIYEEGYVKKLESYGDIYIYGAGKIGKRLETYIKKINKDSKIRYVVSDKGCNSQGNYLEITDSFLNKDSPIFIAVNNIYDKAEMICQAKEQGFQEIFCVDEILFKLI